MTVRHVEWQQRALAVITDPNVGNKFRAGFAECASEVSRFLCKMPDMGIGTRQRIVDHLTNCVNRMSTFDLPPVTNTSAIKRGHGTTYGSVRIAPTSGSRSGPTGSRVQDVSGRCCCRFKRPQRSNAVETMVTSHCHCMVTLAANQKSLSYTCFAGKLNKVT